MTYPDLRNDLYLRDVFARAIKWRESEWAYWQQNDRGAIKAFVPITLFLFQTVNNGSGKLLLPLDDDRKLLMLITTSKNASGLLVHVTGKLQDILDYIVDQGLRVHFDLSIYADFDHNANDLICKNKNNNYEPSITESKT